MFENAHAAINSKMTLPEQVELDSLEQKTLRDLPVPANT